MKEQREAPIVATQEKRALAMIRPDREELIALAAKKIEERAKTLAQAVMASEAIIAMAATSASAATTLPDELSHELALETLLVAHKAAAKTLQIAREDAKEVLELAREVAKELLASADKQATNQLQPTSSPSAQQSLLVANPTHPNLANSMI